MEPSRAQPLRPISSEQRITSLDVARGCALLGILMVNVQLLCQPMAWLWNGGGSNEGPVGVAAYYATRLLFESKSYPLFSLLFGMGLMLMRQRALAAGRSFVRPYLRRLSMLLVMGLLHALLLYYADVLVIYAIIGFFTMWFMGRRSRVLLGLAVSLLTLAVLFSAFSGFMGMRYYASKDADPLAGEPAQAALVRPADQGMQPADEDIRPADEDIGFDAFFEQIQQGEIPEMGPMSPQWQSAAKDAFQNGPLSHAILMRCLEWIVEQMNWTLGAGAVLRIAGMFLLGAWLMKVDALGVGAARWMRRLLLIGLLVGLPCSFASVVLSAAATEHSAWWFLGYFLMTPAGPCAALGYMGLSMWLARRCAAGWFTRSIASMGRMALTNYIMQSLLVCVIVQHWGFAMYGQVSQAQMLVIAVSIFAFQLIASWLWLSRFTMGPLEWLWRWWTYLRRPAFLNR
jgi:uncharacterized protein